MNLVLMRTKTDYLNTWWEPHATSTPLKKIPVDLEVKNTGQKQNQPEKTRYVDSKKSRKNRLSTYFDPSSSSDEESNGIKRPIIKLNSRENNEKILPKNKEPESKQIKTINRSPSNRLKNSSRECVIKARRNKSAVETSKNYKNHSQEKRDGSHTETDICIDFCADSDEENQIFSKRKKKQACVKSKVNVMNYSRNENSRHPSDLNETEKQKLQKMPKANQLLLNPKPVKRNTNKNSQALRNYQKMNTSNNKLTAFHKIKSKKITDNKHSLKTQTKTSVCKAKVPKKSVNTIVCANKSNLSHQLFSESTEQEYIDILDLASDEANEAKENTKDSLPKGNNSVCQPFIWPYHSSHKVCIENKNNEEKPKQKKCTSEKYLMLGDEPPELSTVLADKKAKCVKIIPQKGSQSQFVESSTNAKEKCKENNKDNNCRIKHCFEKNQKYQNDNKKGEPINETESETLPDGNKNYKNLLLNKNTLKYSSSNSEKDVSIQGNEIHLNKDTLKCVQNKPIIDSSEKSVFKQFGELLFDENGSGCSAVECWSVNNVKCGVFKLKMHSQFACQTLHSNSHLGGVLLKGHLKMKIGTKEQDLKEGDMAFVPPLTEWQATNVGESESVFYYWCGRFGKKS